MHMEFLFFSSRRRHTRWTGDWSSDMCSSDLARILQARIRAQRAAELYRRGIARIEDRWAGTGPTGERFQDLRHIYAADLDLFGKIGRASCRERVLISVVAGPLKKKK